MPVLVTIATINLIFRSGSDDEAASFLNPYALRARCMEEIEDTDTQAKAVQLADELQQLAHDYQKAVVASLDAYIEESVKWESSASVLIEQLQPWDSARVETVQGIIRVRHSMRELLTTEQWGRVFG